MKNMTKFVIASIVHIDVFTIMCFVASFFDKDVKDSLIVAFFAAFTGELAGLLVKKIQDKKKEEADG